MYRIREKLDKGKLYILIVLLSGVVDIFFAC